MTAPHRVLIALAALAAFAGSAAAETLHPRAVAELYTSQGCSSCPPADEVWNELSQRDDVLALSLPVHYWDYLGWKDTLARPAHSERQRAYARALHLRSVYTPQGIINGEADVIGSRADVVKAALKNASALGGDIRLDLARANGTLTVSAEGGGGRAGVWLVIFKPSEEVAIGRGENAGRSVTYANIVRDMRKLGGWNGGSATYSADIADLAGSGLRCAVLVQGEKDGDPGEIVAAAVLGEAL